MNQRLQQQREVGAQQAPGPGTAVAGPRQAELSAVATAMNAAPRVRQLAAMAPAVASAARPNRTGLPDGLKAGVESLSGLAMDHVRVHYNSSKPAQFRALAYAQGGDIHVAPGQERHLPHEAWHVVQQVQGRVKPTTQFKDGVVGNDDQRLELEADVMGAKSVQMPSQSLAASDARQVNGALAATHVTQRFMQVGRDKFQLAEPAVVPARSNVRELLTAVQNAFHSRGLVLSAAGLSVLREWCASPDLSPHAFQSPDHVAEALVEAGYFYSKTRAGETTGPSTLGDRPGFTGDANRLEYGEKHGGTARRHVISSSTLGAAIEFSDGTLDEINAFLVRRGGHPVDGSGKIQVLTARRNAWQLVHNHVGNLWIGPSPINTAIGFIRSTINKALRAINRSKDGVKVGTIIQMITPPQGPMDHAARTEWLKFALVLNARLAQLSDATGTLDRAAASEFLLDTSRNADLDIPHQEPGGKYRAQLRAIYAQILGTLITSNNIFQAGGTLDQFMDLDAGTRPPSPSPSSAMVDVPDAVSSQHSSAQAMDGVEEESAGAIATKRLKRLGEVPLQIDGMHVHDVSGNGMNCLIRAMLVAAGRDDHANNDLYVETLRASLIEQGFAQEGRMLDLAGGAGAMLISRLVHEGVLDPKRGLVLYQRNAITGEYEQLQIISGDRPIYLWLSNEHFRAVR